MRLNIYSPTQLLLSDNLHGICKSTKKQPSFLLGFNCTTLIHNPSLWHCYLWKVGHIWGICTEYVTNICEQLVVKYITNYNVMGQCTVCLHSVQRYTNFSHDGCKLNFPRLVHSNIACSLVLIYTHLRTTWKFGADKLCCGLLHVFEVNHGLSWYVQTQLNINSMVCREFCTVTDVLNRKTPPTCKVRCPSKRNFV